MSLRWVSANILHKYKPEKSFKGISLHQLQLKCLLQKWTWKVIHWKMRWKPDCYYQCLSAQHSWIHNLFQHEWCHFPTMQGIIYPLVCGFSTITLEFMCLFCTILQLHEILLHCTWTNQHFLHKKKCSEQLPQSKTFRSAHFSKYSLNTTIPNSLFLLVSFLNILSLELALSLYFPLQISAFPRIWVHTAKASFFGTIIVPSCSFKHTH